MTEKKNDVLDVMVRSDTKSEENISNYEQDADDNKIDDPDVDEEDAYIEPVIFHTPQRNIRPAVYGVLTVVAVIAAFLIGSLIGKVKEEPEPIMTTEPIAETATPEATVLPETSALPSADSESKDVQEEVNESDEEDVEEEQDDKAAEEEETDSGDSKADATPEPSASPTPDPSIYYGVAPVIGGTKPANGTVSAPSTPTPSKPDDTAVNSAASRLLANHAGMSRAELVSGLLSFGYTLEQADRAADNMAVSWTQQAIYRAMSIYDRNTDTRNTLIVELVLAGFSQADAQAAADAVGA